MVDDYENDTAFDDIPTQEDLDDAMIEDSITCSRCGVRSHISDTFSFGVQTVCIECTQDEIDDLVAERDKLIKNYAGGIVCRENGRWCAVRVSDPPDRRRLFDDYDAAVRYAADIEVGGKTSPS